MELNEQELFNLVKAFNEKVDAQKKEIDELKKHIYDDFLAPAEENYKQWDHDTRQGEFKDKYKDIFNDELCDKCKKAEDDDSFDLAGKIFDDYEASDKSIEEGEYVTKVVAHLNEQLDALKDALGAEEIKVETTSDGEVTVEADGEKVAEAETIGAPVEEPKAEEAPIPEVAEPKEETPEEDDNDKEEEDFIKELEAETKGMKRDKAW